MKREEAHRRDQSLFTDYEAGMKGPQLAKKYKVSVPNVYRILKKNAAATAVREEIPVNDIQVGGDHYRTQPIQPWDFIASNSLNFFEGNIVKYVTRWRSKGGIDDLKKAMHYLAKLIELEETKA